MIPCPNCGSDNMVNAIFCRQCQKKLNLDEINPEAFDEPDDGKKAAALTRLITVIVVGILLVIIGLLLIPAKMPGNGANLDDAGRTKAEDKFSAIQGPHPGKRISFTDDEATHAASNALGLPKTGDAKMLPTRISVQFLDDGTVKVVLQQKAFGKVPFCTTVVAKPSVASVGAMEFEIQKASIGMLPCFGPLKPKAVKQIGDVLKEAYQFNSAKANAASVEISANKATYVFPTK